MKHVHVLVALALLWSGDAVAGPYAVNRPATPVSTSAAIDFATIAVQDPWDMSGRLDVGAFLGTKDAPASGFTDISFGGGIFSARTTANDANLFLLDTGNTNAMNIGRSGSVTPIDAGVFKLLAVRMNVTTPAQMFVYASPNSIYEAPSLQLISAPETSPGWRVYQVDLSQSPLWKAGKGSLRIDPAEGRVNETVQIDWARLVNVDPALCMPISWTGNTNADIYLDNDGIISNGFVGLIQNNTVSGNRASPGCPIIPDAFNYNTGALPAGTYRPFLLPPNTNPLTQTSADYAPGTWTINETPTLTFFAPGPEGSNDDFFTTQLNDPVDMDKLTDIDSMVNVTNGQITTLNLHNPDGFPLGPQRVFFGTSAPGFTHCPDLSNPGDAQVTFLSNLKRGRDTLIDPTHYRLFTVEFGIPNQERDLFCGTAARVIWRPKSSSGIGSVSQNLLFTHHAGVNVLDKITVDMNSVIVDQGTGLGGTNWSNNGPIDIFRFDPHEFPDPTSFYIKSAKLTAFEQANRSYTILFRYDDTVSGNLTPGLHGLGTGGTVDLYYDTDKAGFDGTLIKQGVSASAARYDWSIPPGLATPAGRPVYIYAIFSDGTDATCAGAGNTVCNSNRVYAPWPVILDSDYNPQPRLVLSRTTLNFGAAANTATGSDPQTVRLTFVGAGEAPCWTIANSNQNFSVLPSSGTGNQTVTVSLASQTFPGGGSSVATFTVNNGTCGNTMLNPGQQFVANFSIAASPQAPTGAVDTPDDGATVVGSMGITGWVVDDIGVTAVKIYRQKVAGETGDALGRVFIGDANLVEGARPDIEAANPTKPFNYRGGWGYLMLTNFLPNQGNGTFVLQAYATDKDGHETLLGQRTVVAANSTATAPFGAIDTPGQGASVSGASVLNFGWVLSKGPNRADPPAGGAVSVIWDGVVIGSPMGWTSRDDLSAAFPVATYPGIVNALGVFVLNSTLYADGVHTLSWGVVANNGQSAGVGSRYVTTVNGNSLTATDSVAHGDVGRRENEVAVLERSSAIRATDGSSIRPTLAIAPDPTGLRTVYSRSLERVVVDASRPGARRYEAYQVVAGTLRPLPIGAAFDDSRGALYWQPGPGFAGSYDFVIVRDGKERVPVRVVLSPAKRRLPANRLVRGLFPLAN
jgi:hypothetical protein